MYFCALALSWCDNIRPAVLPSLQKWFQNSPKNRPNPYQSTSGSAKIADFIACKSQPKIQSIRIAYFRPPGVPMTLHRSISVPQNASKLHQNFIEMHQMHRSRHSGRVGGSYYMRSTAEIAIDDIQITLKHTANATRCENELFHASRQQHAYRIPFCFALSISHVQLQSAISMLLMPTA